MADEILQPRDALENVVESDIDDGSDSDHQEKRANEQKAAAQQLGQLTGLTGPGAPTAADPQDRRRCLQCRQAPLQFRKQLPGNRDTAPRR